MPSLAAGWAAAACPVPSCGPVAAYASCVTTDLDALVPQWLTLPDLADRLGVEVSRARALVRDRAVVGVKRGERTTFQVPEAFLQPAEDGGEQVIPTLRGTVVVLGDQGLADDEIIAWLFSVEPSLGVAPVEALRAGRRAEVRRVAQALA
jgi:hypothetical protein